MDTELILTVVLIYIFMQVLSSVFGCNTYRHKPHIEQIILVKEPNSKRAKVRNLYEEKIRKAHQKLDKDLDNTL